MKPASREQRELVLALRMHAEAGTRAKGSAGFDALTLSLKDRTHLMGGKLFDDLTDDEKPSITARSPLGRDAITHTNTASGPNRRAVRGVNPRSPKERTQ